MKFAQEIMLLGKWLIVGNAMVTERFIWAPEMWLTKYIMTVTIRPEAKEPPSSEIKGSLAWFIIEEPHVTKTRINVEMVSAVICKWSP